MTTQIINKQNNDNDNVNASQTAPIFIGSSFSDAYQRRLTEIRAVPAETLVHGSLDVHAAVATILGTLPAIDNLREEIRSLPRVQQALVDGLEDYARATGEAHSRFVIATTPREDIRALNEEALKLRETLRADALVLVGRGLVSGERLTRLRGVTGFKNVAFDLIDYANLLADCWPAIQGRTAITVEELQKAKQVGEALVELAGVREQAPAAAAEVALIRDQAMALLTRAYDEIRRAVHFLRWREDDADTIVPSLYAGKTRRRAGEEEAAPPAATSTEAPADKHPTAAPAVAPGMPGGSPYLDG